MALYVGCTTYLSRFRQVFKYVKSTFVWLSFNNLALTSAQLILIQDKYVLILYLSEIHIEVKG